MKKRANPCLCVHRFLTYSKMYRTHYEDDACLVKLVGDSIIAVAYEIDEEKAVKIGECILKIW